MSVVASQVILPQHSDGKGMRTKTQEKLKQKGKEKKIIFNYQSIRQQIRDKKNAETFTFFYSEILYVKLVKVVNRDYNLQTHKKYN